MFDVNVLKTAFRGLVGFLQPDDPTYPDLDLNLTESASGRYVQNIHPLCTIENITNVAPEFKKFAYPAWVSGTVYSISARVSWNGHVYEAQNNVEVEPATITAPDDSENEDWLQIDLLSAWLFRVYDAAVVEMANQIIKQKKLIKTTKSLLDSMKLFDGMGFLVDRIVKYNRFVGVEITVNKQVGLQVQFDKIAMQLDTAQNGVRYYLYHSSSEAPINTFTIDFNKANTMNWKAIQNTILKYYEDSHDVDGIFYFGYYEEDLTGQAVQKVYNFSVAPCMGCNDYNLYAFNAWSKFVKFGAISVPSSALSVLGEGETAADRKLFDTSKIARHFDTNWGFNLSMTVTCDFTQFFIRNKLLMAEALAMQIALNILNEIAFTTRMNVLADKTKALAMAELDERADSGSFKLSYLNSMAALSFDLSGLSSDCLPCEGKKGINRGAV